MVTAVVTAVTVMVVVLFDVVVASRRHKSTSRSAPLQPACWGRLRVINDATTVGCRPAPDLASPPGWVASPSHHSGGQLSPQQRAVVTTAAGSLTQGQSVSGMFGSLADSKAGGARQSCPEQGGRGTGGACPLSAVGLISLASLACSPKGETQWVRSLLQ